MTIETITHLLPDTGDALFGALFGTFFGAYININLQPAKYELFTKLFILKLNNISKDDFKALRYSINSSINFYEGLGFLFSNISKSYNPISDNLEKNLKEIFYNKDHGLKSHLIKIATNQRVFHFQFKDSKLKAHRGTIQKTLAIIIEETLESISKKALQDQLINYTKGTPGYNAIERIDDNERIDDECIRIVYGQLSMVLASLSRVVSTFVEEINAFDLLGGDINFLDLRFGFKESLFQNGIDDSSLIKLSISDQGNIEYTLTLEARQIINS